MSPASNRAIATVLAGLLLVGAVLPVASGAPVEPRATFGGSGSAAGSADSTDGTITGTITTENGSPEGDAWVVAVNTSSPAHRFVAENRSTWPPHSVPPTNFLRDAISPPRPNGIHVTETNENGEYSLSVPAGNFSVFALTTDLEPAPGYDEQIPRVSVSSGGSETVDLQVGERIIVDYGYPGMSFTSGSARSGETVTIDLSTNAGRSAFRLGNVTEYDLTMTFDERVARVVGVESGDFDRPETVEIDNENGSVRIADDTSGNVTAPTIAQIRFEVTTDDPTKTFLLFARDSYYVTEDSTRIVEDGQLPAVPTPPGVISVETSLTDLIAGQDGTVDTEDLQRAISLWVTGQPVPGSGGETIDSETLQRLIQLWVTGQ